jgi:hypothetical protein
MYKGWARQGAFKEIPAIDEMRERWPRLAAIRDKVTSDDLMSTVDGKLYAWMPARQPPDYMNRSNYIIVGYRRDWARQLNLYKENDIYTWDEMKAMIKAFNDQDPGGNGPGNTIGLVAETWCLPTSYMLWTGAPEFYKGYFYDTENGKWTHIMLTQGFKDSLLWFTDLYQQGYMWKDQIVAGGNEGRDYFRAGRSGAFLSNWTLPGMGQHVDAMVQSGVIQSADDIGLATIYSDLKQGEFWYNGIEDFWSMWNFSHKLSDEKMERFLDMWEWADTEDGFNLRNYGIEGVDYVKNADGTIKLNWEKDAMGNFLNPYGDAGTTEMSGPQLDKDFFRLASTRDDVWAEFQKMQNVLAGNSAFHVARVHSLGMYFDGASYLQYGDFKADMDAQIVNIVSSSTNPGADWDAWIETMKPKLQLVLDELEASDVPRENTW